MLKRKSFLSGALLLVLPLAATADVEIYGRANISVDLLDDGVDYSEVSMSSNSSRLGFRANRDLDGITVLLQIEGDIDMSLAGGSNLGTRNTFLGVRGDFGTFKLGRFDTPFKSARGPANFFGDQIGDLRNLARFGNARFDERTPNTVSYSSVDMNGFAVNVAYSLHEGDQSSDMEDDAFSMSLTYEKGPWDVAAAYEKFSDDASRGGRDGFRLAAAYTLDALTLGGFYQIADHNDDSLDSDVFGIGASYKVGAKSLIKAHYFMRSADVEASDSDMFAIGYEYRIRQPLRVYAIYGFTSNDDGVNLTPWNQGRRTDQPGINGETASGLSVGLRYDF
ncbi:MAG: porin [Wenzhouxiangella sp.]|jgi:predicted porin|nr:porin [Wenzhouxiangella sp.]